MSERTVGSKRFAFGELAHIKGHAALWRGMVSERGVVSCYVPSAARSFAFGELAHIEALGVLRYKKGKNKCKFPFSPDLRKKM